MCSSGTSSPVSAETFFSRIRLIVRSSSWLNDTLFLLTAWNSLMGMATSPKLIVPLHTGLGMRTVCPEISRLYSRGRRSAGQHGAGDEIGAERGEDRQVEQPGGGHHGRVVALAQRRLGDEHQHDRGHRACRPEPSERAVPAVVDRSPSTPKHAGRQQQRQHLDRPRPAERPDQLVEVPSRKAGLHEVPVAEQHRVGDRAEERGAGERAQQRHREVAAGVDRGGDKTHDAGKRREQVDDGRELATGQRPFDLSLDAGHLGNAVFFGYSGGLTGQGLYGTLGFSDNNLQGTGNSGSLQLEKGARTGVAQLSVQVPYLGNTPQSQKYSVGGSVFTNNTTYYYPVYGVTASGPGIKSVGATPAPIPVTLYGSSTSTQLNNIVATNSSSATGGNASIARRLSDYTILSVTGGAQTIRYSTTVPSPYYFQGNQPNIFVGPTPGPINSSINSYGGSFGIAASSIANVNTGAPYKLNTAVIGLTTSTLDDPFNPRNGVNASLTSMISVPAFGSNFKFTQSTLNVAKFFPVLKEATLGFHLQLNGSSGVIPPSQLVTFSDQQMRGYNTVFYATDAGLGQIELRQPLALDRRITLAAFVDELDYRIRGAYPLLDQYTNRIVGYPGNWALYGDYGVGVRFDVPQLGLRTVRIDFAKGVDGTHTSFGIGQSF